MQVYYVMTSRYNFSDSYLQVPLHFVQNVLASAAQHNGARLRVLAFGYEGEVLVADLLDLKQSSLRPNVLLLQLFRSVHDGGAAAAGDAVVVRFADAAQHGDAGPDEEVLSEVRHAFLRDHEVRLHADDVVTKLLDVFLFQLKNASERKTGLHHKKIFNSLFNNAMITNVPGTNARVKVKARLIRTHKTTQPTVELT